MPLQITVPDGGEDGRIVWEGGVDHTDFVPGRATFFQCKASNFGKAGWKKECWTKGSRKPGQTRVITPALKIISDLKGHYVGFTTEALTGQKIDDYTLAIKAGITDAGCDPAALGSIKLYGSNEIAAWATLHPSIALWLGEASHQRSLGGYQTIEAWGQRADFVEQPYSLDEDNSYVIGPTPAVDRSGSDDSTTAKAAWNKIVDHVSGGGQSVRVTGSSGLGKSRFLYEAVRTNPSILAQIVANSAVFADYRVVSNSLLPTATAFASDRRDTLLIVDECPHDVAISLAEIAAVEGSRLRVITIDTDDRALKPEVLHISMLPSQGGLIGSIIRGRNPKMKEESVSRLEAVCGGYPRFAILAATAGNLSVVSFQTLDDIVNRVLSGSSVVSPDEVRALEVLAMFDRVPIEGEGNPLDLIARELGRMSGDEMFEHLARAQAHDLVGRYGDEFAAQPRPIAEHLAHRRLRLIRPSLLDRVLKAAPDALVRSLLRRWQYMDTNPIIRQAAVTVLSGHLSTTDEVLSVRGSAMLDALVHIVPDRVADRLAYLVPSLSSEELNMPREARRSLVEATSKLVFRSRCFNTAARLLMKLAVAETEEWANNATGIFKQLYQLELSGTEVPPAERFAILDEGLSSGSDETVKLCIDALESVFRSQFSRFGGTDEIGSGEPLQDWRPATWGEVHQVHRDGLARLLDARSRHPQFAKRCEEILAGATRHLLSTGIYREHSETLVKLANEKGGWPEAIERVGDWLFFDRQGADAERISFVRELYDKLFPNDIIEQAILFTMFWNSDIRDPDVIYKESGSDFEYSERASLALADRIAADRELTLNAVRRMMVLDLKTVTAFAERLGRRAQNREEVFRTALDLIEPKGVGIRMLRGILRGIDTEDHELANACLAVAVDQLGGVLPLINLYSALTIDTSRIDQVIAELKAGRIQPAECAFLSYGRGLDNLPVASVARLLTELTRHGSIGAWTALEVATMYRHGKSLGNEFATEIRKLLVNPDLLEGNSDSHLLESNISAVRGVASIDPEFAAGMAQQILRLAQSDSWEIVSNLKSAIRHLIVALREDQPAVLWSYITRFYESATPKERNRLHDLVGPNADRFDRSGHLESGPLFGLPEDSLFDWADASPERASFLVGFFPTLDVDGPIPKWTSAFEKLGARYGASSEFRKALADRIRPKSWSGSIIPLLEVYLEPLKSWSKHSHLALATWAKDQRRALEGRIEREREHEDA